MKQTGKIGSNRYVFGAALAGVALGGVPALNQQAHAVLVTNADFTFESDTFGTGSATGATTGPFAAEIGTGSAYGSHASTAAVYSTPSGNGSTKSFSSNHFAVGDYYEFAVPTTSLTAVLVSFDQISSGTGPGTFSLAYSVDGTNFSTYTNYSIALLTVTTSTGTATVGWTPTASNAGFNLSFDLSSITGLNNDPNAIFELVDASAAAYNPSSASVGTGGTDRVDNFVVSGTSTAVPEPASLSLLTVAAAAALRRRRA